MSSPFPKSIKTPGEGCIVARRVPEGITTIEVMSFRYPLKMISPSPFMGQKSATIFILSYGGGLVGGDKTKIDMLIREDARLCLLTQGYTKVFGSDRPDKITCQTFHVSVKRDACLCLLPDPVQPYASSIYEQTQIFTIDTTSDVCILDWVSQGRVSLGEDWDFTKWTGTNEVWLSGETNRLLVRDTVILDAREDRLSGVPLKDTMQSIGVFGTLILRGSRIHKLGTFFMKEFEAMPRIGARTWGDEAPSKDTSEELAWRLNRLDVEKQTGLTWSAAHLRGCIIIKFGGKDVNSAKNWLLSMITREGTIQEMFGENATYGLQ
ncbi:urease accessory protein UreD [Ceratocystis lukuohia]|uniref:Urease accessory protein UreD n=1 Tax=Ceratocystis lukuohia TaxID=2019550 RepID=A0ABR4MGM0_9PEZI